MNVNIVDLYFSAARCVVKCSSLQPFLVQTDFKCIGELSQRIPGWPAFNYMANLTITLVLQFNIDFMRCNAFQWIQFKCITGKELLFCVGVV